ncbi:MAG: hypothetical protein JKY37_34455 [Nannocystaceae bacterium]|nr:hypothetical protein [Nannocystaceae bacterium]
MTLVAIAAAQLIASAPPPNAPHAPHAVRDSVPKSPPSAQHWLKRSSPDRGGLDPTPPEVEHRGIEAHEDLGEAEWAYRERIDRNIASLAVAATLAREQGHLERADLMERRISGLTRRAAQFEASLASG